MFDVLSKRSIPEQHIFYQNMSTFEDKTGKAWIEEAHYFLRYYTDYSIEVTLIDLYGCASFTGLHNGVVLVWRRGFDINKHVGSVLRKLVAHAAENLSEK